MRASQTRMTHWSYAVGFEGVTSSPGGPVRDEVPPGGTERADTFPVNVLQS